MFTGSSTDKDSEITHQYGIGTSRMITIEAGIPFENFDFGYNEINKLIVSDPKRMIQYEVFPNPVINEIRVKVPFNDHLTTKYFIINYLGNLVKSGEIQGESEILETGHLPEGRYTIHFINGREQIMKSFIKIDN
ncbi:MAG: Secretion system C-terminal sorting domain, partial [Bacteroidota bacterium]